MKLKAIGMNAMNLVKPAMDMVQRIDKDAQNVKVVIISLIT